MFSMFDFMFNIMFILFFVVFVTVVVIIAITAFRGLRHTQGEPQPQEPEQKIELRCPYCGAPIHKDDKKCLYCDAKL